jgi:hypothetical protein
METLIPLFVEKDYCLYQYLGSYRLVETETILDRHRFENRVVRTALHQLAWRVWRNRGVREDFHKALAASFFPKEKETEWTGEGTEKVMALEEEQVINRFMNVCKAFLIDLP